MERRTYTIQATKARRARGKDRRLARAATRPGARGARPGLSGRSLGRPPRPGSLHLIRWGAVGALAALALLAVGIGSAMSEPAPNCVIIDDQGHCGDFTSVQLDGDHQAQQAPRATINADLAQGGYIPEGGWNINPPPCRMRGSQCVPNVCYRTGGNPLKTRWGYFPTGQVVYEDRVWCGYLNWYQTYRASRLRTGTGGAGSICHANAPQYKYKTAGGNGYFSTSVHTGSHFSCSVPSIPIGFQDFQVWNCNMAGRCHETNWGHE